MAVRKICSLALALVLGATSVAHAAPGPSAAERETARRLMDEGKARLKANELARAIEAFQKAHDIMHVPTTGLALAKAHLAAGHLVEARDAALEIGRLPHDPADPAVFDTARKHAKELDAQLKPRIPTVRIKIKGGSAARVAVDDVEIPVSIIGEPVAMNPGKRVVKARSADGAEARGEIELVERDAKEIELTLSPRSDAQKATKTPTSSTASNSGNPGSTGASDGTDKGSKLRRFGNSDDVVGRPSGERTPLANGLFFGGLGVGAVGVTVGAITGALTLSKASDVDPQCERNVCAPSARNDLDSANTLATVSTIAFIAGGVGVVAGVVGFLLPSASTSESRAGASAITIGPAGAGIGGTF